jgi:hypothetical protein
MWRWPGKTGGAIHFALIFLLTFLSRKKVRKKTGVAPEVSKIISAF